MRSFPRFKCLHLLNSKPSSSHHLKQIHSQLIINGLKSPPLLAKLIEQYCSSLSSHSTTDVQLVLRHLDQPNLFLFNTFIRCSSPEDSILSFASWVSREGLKVDEFSYIFVLGACARSASLWEGKQIHTLVLKHGFSSNLLVQTTKIHFYSSNKDVKSARNVFDEMLVRTSITWNAMIKGYCSQGDRIGKCAWEALALFQDMLVDDSGVKPTDVTMLCLLSAASRLGVLETGACIHGYIVKTVREPENDVFIGTGLVDMYAKCGCLESALYVFEEMREKNVLTWTAMTNGLALHGRGKEALKFFGAMDSSGVKPNAVTFTSLLTACCHASLVEEGLHLFHEMDSKFGVTAQLQHYGCIVDLLGRAGHLKEAYEFIKGIPVKHDAILWKSLLSACRVHGNVVTAEKVGKILQQLESEQISVDLISSAEDFVALSNIYASAERWDNVEMIRRKMKARGMEFQPGRSFSLNH